MISIIPDATQLVIFLLYLSSVWRRPSCRLTACDSGDLVSILLNLSFLVCRVEAIGNKGEEFVSLQVIIGASLERRLGAEGSVAVRVGSGTGNGLCRDRTRELVVRDYMSLSVLNLSR